jgi:hypothetical protein
MPHTHFGNTDRIVYILDVTGHDPGTLTFISSHKFVCIYESANSSKNNTFSTLQHAQTDSGAVTDPLLDLYEEKSAGA